MILLSGTRNTDNSNKSLISSTYRYRHRRSMIISSSVITDITSYNIVVKNKYASTIRVNRDLIFSTSSLISEIVVYYYCRASKLFIVLVGIDNSKNSELVVLILVFITRVSKVSLDILIDISFY